MKTLMELESRIDKKKTIRTMKKELEQLYYFGNSYMSSAYDLKVEEPGAAYHVALPAGKLSKSKKQFVQQMQQVSSELLYGIRQLPEKERVILEELYLRKHEKEEVCKNLSITDCTLRRRSQSALYHLAILLHKTIMLEE